MNHKRKQQAGAWVRFVDKGPLRIKVESWYNRQADKTSPLVRKVLDLAHWDFVLDFYTIEHLLTKYPDPTESELVAALIECGYPPEHAEARSKQQPPETMGFYHLGGHHSLKYVNPLKKYLDRNHAVQLHGF